MRRNAIDNDLNAIAFDFFFWFSRFESALKSNNYLKSSKLGARAEPGWDLFVRRWEARYAVTEDAQVLVALAPMTQIVGEARALTWVPVVAEHSTSTLGCVVLMLKTVRNNLFHGGKHGADSWDDPARVRKLLTLCIQVLHELAELGEFSADFDRVY